jgi:methylmalonyl-CoA/ethylmalonyl-CoA epimerase
MRIDHLGVATENADELADQYSALFGASVAHEEEFDGLKVVFLDFEGSYFELLEPIEEGTVSRYLDRHGAGIHHAALRTEDIDGALETAREHGVELINDEPRPGAWGHDVAFLHPKSTGGVLVEYVEH